MTTPNIPEQSSDGLLACPFCGGEATVDDISTSYRKGAPPFWFVGCFNNDCPMPEATGASSQDKAAAITAWNTRALTPEQLSPLSDGVVTDAMIEAGLRAAPSLITHMVSARGMVTEIYLAMSAHSRPLSDGVGKYPCPGNCGVSRPLPPPLPGGVDESRVLDAFYSAVPEHFGSCFGDPKGERHGTVAASMPLCPNDLAYLRGIRAAIAALSRPSLEPSDAMIERISEAYFAGKELAADDGTPLCRHKAGIRAAITAIQGEG